MLRLKAEFDKDESEYSFEIKRGEEGIVGRIPLTNEFAGRLLLAFDLEEPYAAHQLYRVFDDKYAEIFGRPEVTASRIAFINDLYALVTVSMSNLKHDQMRGYALTKFFILSVLKRVMLMSPTASALLLDREAMKDRAKRDVILASVPGILDDLVIDFNYEIDEEGEGLDYKSDLKSPERVRSWTNKLLSSYEKELKKGKAGHFG